MKNIMVVDDSNSVRNILKAALITEYEIAEAVNGMDALNRLQVQDIDLFLLDVNMPEMDGLTLLKEIRKIGKYKQTPVIMLTTETKDELRSEGKIAGANGWITKPCEPDKLLKALRKILGQ
jgi:two-component system chemotaxis response regulator CheY